MHFSGSDLKLGTENIRILINNSGLLCILYFIIIIRVVDDGILSMDALFLFIGTIHLKIATGHHRITLV